MSQLPDDLVRTLVSHDQIQVRVAELAEQINANKTCVLVRKTNSTATLQADYLGFDIPDVWAVGYGLDCAEKYRTLPFIAEIKR